VKRLETTEAGIGAEKPVDKIGGEKDS
jgi:hypothetical protein